MKRKRKKVKRWSWMMEMKMMKMRMANEKTINHFQRGRTSTNVTMVTSRPGGEW